MTDIPFWRIAPPPIISASVKKDLAECLEATVLTYNLCVERNLQSQRNEGVEKSKEDVSNELKEFCMKEIFNASRVYRYNLSMQIERLDFYNVVTQWGYMYVYMCRHIHLVYHVMSMAWRGNCINVTPDVKNSVCAIGAGPGSDVLGLLMFFREIGISSPFSEINLLDRCVAWDDSWQSLRDKLPRDMSDALKPSRYHHFDFFVDYLTEDQRKIISRATFITFIKSISPVSAWLSRRKSDYNPYSVNSLLQCIQPGAIILYIDNGGQHSEVHRRIILDSALLLGYKILYDSNLNEVRMPCDGFSKNCKEFMKYMDFRPCSVSGKNDALLLWKPHMPPSRTGPQFYRAY